MSNYPKNPVLHDIRFTVDGVIFHELINLNKVLIMEDGVQKEYQILTHTRSIGERTYTTKKRMVNGASNGEETIETNMAPEQIEDFKNEWDANREVSSLFYEGV